MPGRNEQRLWRLAWISVGAHVIGLVLAVVGIRPGFPLVTLEERLAYLSTAPLPWAIGWGVWIACSLAFIAFLVVLRGFLPERSVAATLAIALAGAGLAVDLVCDTVYITVMPALARSHATELFLTLERALGAAAAVVANGLFSVAVFLMTRRLAAHGNGPRHVAYLGYATFLFGMLMAVGGFTGNPRYLELATGPMVAAFCGWTLAVTRHLTRPSQRP